MPRPADAIVVLGAAQYDGRPSPQLAARLDHVVTLYEQGVAPVVVVTGGKQPNDRFTEAESSAQYLVDRGVPAEAIVMETSGRTTSESMAGTADLLDATRPRSGGGRHRPVPRIAVAAHRPGRRADGVRVADADVGGPRRQRRAAGISPRPPPSPSAESSASTTSDPPDPQPMGVYGTERSPIHPSVVAAIGFSVAPMGSGVTGNTADSGSVIRGSIPLSPARRPASLVAWRTARRLGVRQHGPFV